MITKFLNKKIVSGVLISICTNSLAFDAGGVGSGGGGTLPINPVSIQEINEIAIASYRDLQLIFIKEISNFNTNLVHTALEQKLYGNSKTVLDVLKVTSLELRDNSPCYDSEGNEVEGSIYAKSPDTICISSFRVAPKIDKDAAYLETAALIAHELSHLMGANESEARSFQRYLLEKLRDFKVNKSSASDFLNGFRTNLLNIDRILSVLAEHLDELSESEIHQLLFQLKNESESFENFMWDSVFHDTNAFSLFNEREKDITIYYWDSFVLLYQYYVNRQSYLGLFENQSQITYDDYLKSHWAGSGNRGRKSYFNGPNFQKITSNQEIKNQLNQIRNFVLKTEMYVNNLIDKNPWK